jgi:hypothetical protein
MPSDVSDLCQRIRQRCRERLWYGADAEALWLTSPDRTWRETWYDLDGTLLEVIREPPRERFAQARATAEQIAQTEHVLGCRLPRVLTAVYLQVANGGFGPGYGLDTVESLAKVTRGSWRLGARAAHYLEAHPHRYLECDEGPEGLVRLCDWGCGLGSVLDLASGRVYGRGSGTRSDWNGVPPDASEFVLCMDFQATSVEDWFERWLRGEVHQPLTRLEGFDARRDEGN